MNTQTVVKAEQLKTGLIIHKVKTNKGQEMTKEYVGVRGGLVWPTAISPGYFIVLGEEYSEKHQDLAPVSVMCEHEMRGLSFDKLFSRMCDSANQYYCGSYYCNIEEESKCFETEYYSYLRNRDDDNTFSFNLRNADGQDNFILGFSRCKAWLESGKLVLPEGSIIREQLKQLTKADLEDSPETRFSAVNALMHVVTSFYRNRPGLIVPFVRQRRSWR